MNIILGENGEAISCLLFSASPLLAVIIPWRLVFDQIDVNSLSSRLFQSNCLSSGLDNEGTNLLDAGRLLACKMMPG
ncbi:hypothetical protein CEXT_638871 [Caerostris extrusa]|uniref:Uncharacterized protein n=1 Tax=Caerostris extrusa TaxID=172846 RepID=A0AAV4X641_CAEEX|nr:hypothetical protein CEXT_638871 [Caerostris extrusa]